MLNFDWLTGLSIEWARFALILAFVGAFIFSLTFSAGYIYSGSDDKKPWRNLKSWILILVIIQIVLYIIF